MVKHPVPPPDEQDASLPSATLYAVKAVCRENTIAGQWVVIGVLVLMILVQMSWSKSVHVEAMHHVPTYVGITPEGERRILPPEWVKLRPEDLLIVTRRDLLHWAQDHYSRLPSGYFDYDRSRLFMEDRLATSEERRVDHEQIKQISEGQRDSTIVVAQNVTFEDSEMIKRNGCPETPGKRCRALIDAQRAIVGRNGEMPTETRQLKISIEFLKLDKVPDEIIRENPLGIVITDIHVSEAIK